MPLNNNSSLTREFREAGRVTSMDIPNKIGDTIIPVMEVNPKLLRVVDITKQNQAINATSATIYTTPTDSDFYLTGASLTVSKDANATSVASYIQCILADNGDTVQICYVACTTTQAQNGGVSHDFTFPIKVKRGTAISVYNTTNVASIRASAVIYGYLVPNYTA